LRARRGVARPIFYKGEKVGEYRHYDERLTMFLLRSRRPQRYGKWIDRMLAPADEQDEESSSIYDDPGMVLDGGLTGIEFNAEDVPPENDDDDDDDAPTAL